jgi:hypothetical protein
MQHKIFHHALFLTAMVLASSAFAQSEEAVKDRVARCVDAGGHVTLTDQPCQDTVKTEAPAAKAVIAEHDQLPAAEVHHKAWVKAVAKTPVPHRPSPDVATLKAARETMQMAQSNRQQRLAGLD